MTFTEQTGYRRQGPHALCQEHAYLLAATKFDYDLSDPEFVAYFERRTGIALRSTGSYSSPRHRTREEWDDMAWHIMNGDETPDRILRGRLQDCWELYCAYELPTLPQAAAA
jgi:hypothetical protein